MCLAVYVYCKVEESVSTQKIGILQINKLIVQVYCTCTLPDRLEGEGGGARSGMSCFHGCRTWTLGVSLGRAGDQGNY